MIKSVNQWQEGDFSVFSEAWKNSTGRWVCHLKITHQLPGQAETVFVDRDVQAETFDSENQALAYGFERGNYLIRSGEIALE